MATRLEIKNYERFVTLARYFIDSYNPKPDNMSKILDMILSTPDELVPMESNGRYFAHDFCLAAMACLDGRDPARWMHPGYKKVTDWMVEWKKANT
jgi:hypothetical protein